MAIFVLVGKVIPPLAIGVSVAPVFLAPSWFFHCGRKTKK